MAFCRAEAHRSALDAICAESADLAVLAASQGVSVE